MEMESVEEYLARGGTIKVVVSSPSRGPRKGVRFKKWDRYTNHRGEKVWQKTRGAQGSRGTKFSVKVGVGDAGKDT